MTASWAVQMEYRGPLHPLQGHPGLTDPLCVLRGGREDREGERKVGGGRGGKEREERVGEEKMGRGRVERVERGKRNRVGKRRMGRGGEEDG